MIKSQCSTGKFDVFACPMFGGLFRDSKKTFKPNKPHKKGKQAELHAYAQATLGRWAGCYIQILFPHL